MYTLDLNIMWDEPAELNGVITSYEVTVAQTDNSSAIVYTNDSLTVTSVTQSVMVLPFTNYTVTVRASTSAGQGEGVTTNFESPQAGEDLMFLLYRYLNNQISAYMHTSVCLSVAYTILTAS